MRPQRVTGRYTVDMTTRTIAGRSSSENDLGQVYVTVTVENSGVTDASAKPAELMIVELQDVLMDTGATLLCLPAHTIAQLGLPFVRDVYFETATGIEPRRLFRRALVRYLDREADVDCIELPADSPPLLGAIPMETMGIAPNLRDRSVRVLPEGPTRSHVRA